MMLEYFLKKITTWLTGCNNEYSVFTFPRWIRQTPREWSCVGKYSYEKIKKLVAIIN